MSDNTNEAFQKIANSEKNTKPELCVLWVYDDNTKESRALALCAAAELAALEAVLDAARNHLVRDTETSAAALHYAIAAVDALRGRQP